MSTPVARLSAAEQSCSVIEHTCTLCLQCRRAAFCVRAVAARLSALSDLPVTCVSVCNLFVCRSCCQKQKRLASLLTGISAQAAGALLTDSNSGSHSKHASDIVFQDSRASSPTRSTAGTPGFESAKYGGMRQLGTGALMQQSPHGIRHNMAGAAPASPASSMHSYRSTSELIESIQNRYLEAQSFLKSYKL